jgi:hypothetical protein
MHVTPAEIDYTTKFISFVKDLALVAAAVWATIRFRKERTYEAALEIGFGGSTLSTSSPTTTLLEVTLTNRGKLMLQVSGTDELTPVEDVLCTQSEAQVRLIYGDDRQSADG